MRSLKYTIYATFGLAIIVVVLGSYTRLTEAGLGCPDWPGCYGFLTVPDTLDEQKIANASFPDSILEPEKAWNEMVHRYVAGTLGILVLLINLWCWRYSSAPKLLPFCLLCVVSGQALLGMLTVTLQLMPLVVMGHLLGGFTTLSLLFLLVLRFHRLPNPSCVLSSSFSSSLFLLSVITFGVVFFQIALGGWVASNYAAVVCTQLPICEANWQQDFQWSAFELIQPTHDSYQFGVLNYEQRVSIHVVHRIGAIVTAFFVGLLAWRLWQYRRRESIWLIVMLLLQVGLGVSNVLLHIPVGIAVGHNLGGAFLLLSVLRINVLLSCWRARVDYRYQDISWPRRHSL